MRLSPMKPCLLAASVALCTPAFVQAQLGGTITELGSGGRSFSDTNPDIAYDPNTDVYAHVFEGFNASNNNYQIRLKLFDAKTSSGISGGDIQMAGGTSKMLNPCVGYIAKTGMFLVAWQDDASGSWDIKCRAYDPKTKTASGTLTVAATNADEITPDIAGDATNVDDDAVLVWDDEGVGIRATEIEVQSLTAMKVLGIKTLAAGAKPLNNNPAVSNTGGAARRIALAYEANSLLVAVEAYTLDLVAASAPLKTPLPNPSFPAVDGDGSEFVVVVQRSETTTSTLGDIWSYSVKVPATATQPMSLIASPRALAANANQDEIHPAVAYVGSGYLATWGVVDKTGPLGKCRIQPLTIDSTCGNGWLVQYANRPRTMNWLAVASQHNSDATTASRKARVIYDTGWTPATGPRSILQKVNYEVVGGPKTSIANGCGGGGSLSIPEPFAFGERVTPTLSGADKTAVVALAMLGTSAARTQFPCGSCSILLGPISFPLAVSAGKAQWSVGIPCNAAFKDLELDFQYIVYTPGTSPCPTLPNFSASDIVRAKVQ